MDLDNKNYNLSGIAGHEKQLVFLSGLIAGDRMPSGLLFYGQKNIGKRLAATAFAASVICGDYKSYSGLGMPASLNFCGKCPSCMSILNGTSQNLMLAEPSGSSIKIENIHRIGSFLSLTPAYPGYRFVIIDEASSMNTSAANALLKMLEEPREKTVFILISSNVSMLLPTVISRCLLLGFSPIPDEVLSNVFKAEYPDIEDEALRLCSKLARGSYSGFRRLIEGRYLEKRNFLMNNVFKELFEEYKINNNMNLSKGLIANPYDISAKFNIMEKDRPKKGSKASENDPAEENEDKSAVFELILFILRDIYIYYVSKNEKLLYNEDIADEIKRLAVDSGITQKGLAHMIDLTAEHIEKINSYNLNKTISVDSYFYKLLSV
ncbi:MAG: DNA polymerase III subunit [bacterium]